VKNKKRIGDENHGKQRKKEFNREANDLCGSCRIFCRISVIIFERVFEWSWEWKCVEYH